MKIIKSNSDNNKIKREFAKKYSKKCICPSCGTKINSKDKIICYKVRCPKCATKMIRDL